MSLYLMPLSISILLYLTHREIATLLQRVILGVNIAIPIIIRLIHMTGAVHMNRFAPVLQMIAVVEIVALIPPLVLGVRNQQKEKTGSESYTGSDADYYLLVGIIIMIVMTTRDISWEIANFQNLLKL